MLKNFLMTISSLKIMDYIKYEKNNFKSIHQIFVDAKPIWKEILRIFTTLNQNNVQLSDHCTFIFVT